MIPQKMRPYLEDIKGFEGSYPHMYVDPNGYVTIGIGHNLSAHKDATYYMFLRVRDKRKAINGDTGVTSSLPTYEYGVTNVEIKYEFDFMTKHHAYLKHKQFPLTKYKHPQKPYTTLELNETSINMIFEADIDNVIGKVVLPTTEFRDFATFPGAAQAGIVDLAFNVKGFPQKWPGFRSAVAQRNWRKAAAESKRTETDDNAKVLPGLVTRNQVVRQWFEQAAREDPQLGDFVGGAGNMA